LRIKLTVENSYHDRAWQRFSKASFTIISRTKSRSELTVENFYHDSPASFRAITNAPCPPMEWPEIERNRGEMLNSASTSAGRNKIIKQIFYIVRFGNEIAVEYR